jgi:hypothetical protein
MKGWGTRFGEEGSLACWFGAVSGNSAASRNSVLRLWMWELRPMESSFFVLSKQEAKKQDFYIALGANATFKQGGWASIRTGRMQTPLYATFDYHWVRGSCHIRVF